MPQVSWSPRSREDVLRIFRYVLARNPRAAARLKRLIEDEVSSLGPDPGKGRRGARKGTRELVLHENYVAPYRVDADGVRVLRVFHAAQRRP